jgi:hypothetical protein
MYPYAPDPDTVPTPVASSVLRTARRVTPI